jgi:hypothetical protein
MGRLAPATVTSMRATPSTASTRLPAPQSPACPRSPEEGFPEWAARTREQAGRRRLLWCALALIASLTLAIFSLTTLAVGALLAALYFGHSARTHFARARIAEIGARTERIVNSQLGLLAQRGWMVGHNIPCRGIGDIDQIAIAPAPSPAFIISTKTNTYTPRDLQQIAAVAREFDRAAGREHATAILVRLTDTRAHVEHGVIVCDVYDLVRVMRSVLAEYRHRPGAALQAA